MNKHNSLPSQQIEEIKLRAFDPIFPDEMLDALLEVTEKLNELIRVVNAELAKPKGEDE